MKPPLRLFRDVYDRHKFYVNDSDGVWVFDSECDTESDLEYIVAAVNACHRAGLTVEQLEALTKAYRQIDEAKELGALPDIKNMRPVGWELRETIDQLKEDIAPFMKTAE